MIESKGSQWLVAEAACTPPVTSWWTGQREEMAGNIQSRGGAKKGPRVSAVYPLQVGPFVNTEITVFVVLATSILSGQGMDLRMCDWRVQDLCLSPALSNKAQHSHKPLCFSVFVFVHTCWTPWSLPWQVYCFSRVSGDYGFDSKQTQPTSLWRFLDHSPKWDLPPTMGHGGFLPFEQPLKRLFSVIFSSFGLRLPSSHPWLFD